MATVLLGSTSPQRPSEGTSTSVNGEPVETTTDDLPSKTVVLIETPDTDVEGNPIPLDKKLSEIRNALALHSQNGAEWVEGVDEDFTKNVSQTFNCQVGRPDGWDDPAPQKAEPVEALKDPVPSGALNAEEDPSLGEGVVK